jgi:hypothetical protein
MRTAWIAAGLVALGAIANGGAALAGTAGITINPGGIRPGKGDPPWDYVFDVYLDPGFGLLAGGPIYDFYQVTGLVGVASDSLTSEPNSPPNVIWVPTPATETATWTFFGTQSILNTGTTREFLGSFVVETDQSYPSPPVAPGTLIDYNFQVYQIDTGTHIKGSNTFPLILLGVPEPSSVVMLAVGAGAAAGMVLRRRRTRTPSHPG